MSRQDSALELGHGISIPLAEVELRASRSSGPGGQHANVTASRVEASLDLAASLSLDERARARLIARFGRRVTAIAQDARSQARNRELALERLEGRLRAALAPRRARRATMPTAAARAQRRDAKRRRSAIKRERRRPPQP